jgi:hypothetical protein
VGNKKQLSAKHHQDKVTYKDILSGLSPSGRYAHLQIILHREYNKTKPEFGRKFLFVSRDSFGLVKVNDVSLEENHICMALQDAFSGTVKSFKIPVHNKSFRFLLIAWEDVLDIAIQENAINLHKDDLLELDY